jgi:IS30 family transposase
MAGRPKAIIDWKKVDGYLRAGCTGTSIAGLLGIHHDTLYDACQREHKTDFSAYSQQKKAEGISLVRATLYQKALTEKDNTCLIFIAKTDGGMTETQNVNQNNSGQVTVEVKITADDLRSDPIE